MERRRNPDDGLVSLALAGLVGVGAYVAYKSGAFGGTATPARSGSARTGGSPTVQPGTSRPPAQQAPSGQVPTTSPNIAIVVDFWSDKYSYPVGEAIELSGFVYQWDGQAALRLPGRKVAIVDPDVGGGAAWLWATTDQEGAYRIVYHGGEASHWRSYAVDEASGATTGTMDFYPQAAAEPGGTSSTGGDASDRRTDHPYDDLWRAYDVLAWTWAQYSGSVETINPQVNQDFLATWTDVHNALNGAGTNYFSRLLGEANQRVALMAITATGQSPDGLVPGYPVQVY